MALSQRNRLLFFAVLLTCLLFCTSFFPVDKKLSSRAQWTYPDGYDPHGVYLDRVTFVVYPAADEQLGLQALQAGLIYAWDERVPMDNIAELEATPGVEVTSEPADMYRMFNINCNLFPTNITGYRRAIAYALDKRAVIFNSTGGLAFLQDCVMPIALGNLTYEGELTETYYSRNIVAANASLEAAGFRDLDGNGLRDYDADNSSTLSTGDILDINFAIELHHTAGHIPSQRAVEIACEGLLMCGILAEVVPLDFWDMQDLLIEKEYWLTCYTFTNVNSADFLFDYFHSESSTNAWYFGGFNNSEFDTAVEAMMAAPTQEEVNNWAWECQRILWFEQPMIVCYNYVYTHAYRTGRWEGYVNMATRNRICNGYSLVHLRLKELAGGPFGCFPTEYVMSLQEGLDTTNWLMSTSEHTDKVFQLAYEELWTLSPFDLSPQPGLAYAWEIQPTVASGDIQNGEKYTFHLYENATWHDGVPVTSTDVAFSVDLALLDPYDAEKYQHIYRTNILDASTIELYTTATGYLEWLRSTGFTIYPEHIWNDIAITGGNVTTWVPIVPELVGSGPYQFTSWVPGQYVVLERHADWHFQIEHPPRTPCPPPTMDGYPLLGIPIMIILIQVCILGILLVRRSRVRSKKKWR